MAIHLYITSSYAFKCVFWCTVFFVATPSKSGRKCPKLFDWICDAGRFASPLERSLVHNCCAESLPIGKHSNVSKMVSTFFPKATTLPTSQPFLGAKQCTRHLLNSQKSRPRLSCTPKGKVRAAFSMYSFCWQKCHCQGRGTRNVVRRCFYTLDVAWRPCLI